jgi:hypothetical protein
MVPGINDGFSFLKEFRTHVGKICDDAKVVTYVERVSEDEMYVKQNGNEGIVCDLC